MISIVTDSTCYLSTDILRKHNISMVPLKVQFGLETFNETAGISNQAFYQRLAACKGFPTTSQPVSGEFKAAYQKILVDNPAADIIVLTVSSKLSGTYNMAVSAASELQEFNIVVFDSLSAALGLGLMVITAAEMAADGHLTADILTRLEQMRREISMVFLVDSLNYLRRGGRIGAASTLLGTLLNVKPLLTLAEGNIIPLEQVRTKQKAMNQMVAALKSRLPAPNQPVQAGVMYNGARSDMDNLVQIMRNHFNITRLFTAEFGPVIGVHVGPGSLGAGIYPEPG